LLAFSCTKHCLSGSAEIKKQQQPIDPLAHFLKLFLSMCWGAF
jgi:hypothetical protein